MQVEVLQMWRILEIRVFTGNNHVEVLKELKEVILWVCDRERVRMLQETSLIGSHYRNWQYVT